MKINDFLFFSTQPIDSAKKKCYTYFSTKEEQVLKSVINLKNDYII